MVLINCRNACVQALWPMMGLEAGEVMKGTTHPANQPVFGLPEELFLAVNLFLQFFTVLYRVNSQKATHQPRHTPIHSESATECGLGSTLK